MYPIPPSETLVETKTCRHCSASFPITDKDLEFYEKVSPVFPLEKVGSRSETETGGLVAEVKSWEERGLIWSNPPNPLSQGGESNSFYSTSRGRVKIEWNKVRYLIPTPTLCPDCRFINRQSFINPRKLYKRKCDATGKATISNYSPDKPHQVYESSFWLSPDSDFTEYWQELDFSRPFFEQYGQLFLRVPRMSLDQWANMENSTYNNYADDLKDCYMCADTIDCESCYYSTYIFNSRNCTDCFISNENSECYECTSCKKCYKLHFSQNCDTCGDSLFLKNCKNCKNCLFCINLIGKEYCIFNKQYSQEEYDTKKQEIIANLGADKDRYLDEFQNFCTKNIVKYANITESENCTGEDISHSKNIKSSYLTNQSENVAYSFNANEAVNCHDCDGFGIEKSYYTVVTGWASYNCLFCVAGWENCKNLIYCDYCFFNCSDCFGCIGLKNKSYCILNKQYTKDEYEALVPRIIEHMMSTGEWGEFFPSSLSPFGYNETVAMEYYPLTKPHPQPFSTSGEGSFLFSFPSPYNGEGSGVRFNWSDYEAPFPRVEKIIPAGKLPDDISQIPDDILNWAIECEVTKKPFRIIKQELEFYRKHNLPIPRRHPDVRHADRMALRNPRKLFERKCDKCGVEMVTTYSPERKERVYCEGCYEKEVIG